MTGSAFMMMCVGAVIGAAVAEGPGAAFGAGLGLVIAMLAKLRGRLEKLESERAALEADLQSLRKRFEADQRELRAKLAALAATSVAARTDTDAAKPTPELTPPLEAAVEARAPITPSTDQTPEPNATAARIAAPSPTAAGRTSEPSAAAATRRAAEPTQPAADQLSAAARIATGITQKTPVPSPPPEPSPPHAPVANERPASHDPLAAAIAFVRNLLLGGNTVVRAGILVMLVGISLLLRWAAENALFPIELRMAAVAMIALALVVVGYRQRDTRAGFGRTLQGGGIAALYLVVFFSFRSYSLLPSGLAFGLLAVIALSSGVLAVLQDSQSLIIIGQIGGFMAPVLASSGGGSHVALFSYYTVLNLLTLALAWFKPWRALHRVGFAFTFGVATAWGALRYRPDLFASSEPFLIVFFAIYTAIPLLRALRRPEARGGLLDASLVFGTPLSALLLQYAMLKDTRFGMAYTSLALGAFYLGLARTLRSKAPQTLRDLVDALVALAIGFATLAVPYGLDNHNLTGATWALEGAGLYWAGTRQSRLLSRLAGVGLLMLAYASLATRPDVSHLAHWPIANTRFLSGVLVVLASLFIARLSHAHRQQRTGGEWQGLQALILVGLCLWFEIAIHELTAHVGDRWRPGSTIALIGATALALELLGRRLAWLPARYPAALLLPLLPLLLLGWEQQYHSHPLSGSGALGFSICALASIALLRGFAEEVPTLAAPMHALALWSLAGLLALEVWHCSVDFAGLNLDWGNDAVAVCIALMLALVLRTAARERWPFTKYRAVYCYVAAGVLVAFLLLWTLRTNLVSPGDPRPLPYLPLLNPLDLAQLLVFVVCLGWRRHVLRQGYRPADTQLLANLGYAIGALAFLWFNALLARSVHHMARVAFEGFALWRSSAMQVAISVSWSLLGLCATVRASRRALRGLWILGATLLGVVVLKLFVVDLAALSTGIKIGTFLLVGLLLVLVGYFAPVPPAAATGVTR